MPLAKFILLAALTLFTARAADKMRVYIGTYTGGGSKGIYAYELGLKNGALTPLGLAAESPNPSFLAIHPNKKFLYAAGEIGDYQGGKSGAVTGFRIDPASGKLAKINDAGTGGSGTCHLVVDHSGRAVLAANYGGGSICALPINENGELSAASSFIQHEGKGPTPRQSFPFAHSIHVDPRNRFVIEANLGLDKLFVYRFDPEKRTLTPHTPPSADAVPGGGPRHFAFQPGGRFAFVNNEMLSSVTAFSYDGEKGVLTPLQTLSTLPADWSGKNNSTAEIQAHPSGKFVYCSNRGHNSIAVFSVSAGGQLALVENESTRGKTPRNFGIDPTGQFLIAANQDSDSLAVFRIDAATGQLEPVGEPVTAPKPVCVKFLPLE